MGIADKILLGNPAGCFADDFEQTDQGEIKLAVCIEISSPFALSHGDGLPGVIQHVAEPYNIFMSRHIEHQPRRAPDHGSIGSGTGAYSGLLYAQGFETIQSPS